MDRGASTVIEMQCKTRRPFKTAAFWHIPVISLGSPLVSKSLAVSLGSEEWGKEHMSPWGSFCSIQWFLEKVKQSNKLRH